MYKLALPPSTMHNAKAFVPTKYKLAENEHSIQTGTYKIGKKIIGAIWDLGFMVGAFAACSG
jgi:hypothetical protein